MASVTEAEYFAYEESIDGLEEFSMVGFAIPMQDLYRNVDFELGE